MTKTDQTRRKWLDSLKAGDLVCVSCYGYPNQIAAITGRGRQLIKIERASYSAQTGMQAFVPGVIKSRIDQVTDDALAALEHQRVYRAVESRLHSGVRTPVLHLFELILDWQHSPDVILAATERILEVTKERIEAQR